MSEFFTHILQTTISIIVLYFIYWLFLKKETFFSLNRFYLLGALMFSVWIPFFSIDLGTANSTTTFVVFLETIQISPEKIERSFFQNMDVYETISIVYIAGASLFSIRLLFQLLQLAYFISRSRIIKLDQYRLIYHEKFYLPFSFFNLIFVNTQKLNETDLTDILIHEKTHSKQWHTLDLLFLEVLTIFQWFNPIVWLYRSSIKEIHEYIADAKVISAGSDQKKYFELLLNQNLGYQINDLTNNFQKSLIKKRMLMMTKQKSNPLAKLKVLTFIPAAIVLMVVIAFSSADAINASESQTDNKSEIFQIVEEMPVFKGGEKALAKFLQANIKYPKNVVKKGGVQGRVYVTFVIETDGSVTNVKLVRGISRSLDKEALRVVKLTDGEWKPGYQKGKAVRVQFNLPVRFVLDGKKM